MCRILFKIGPFAIKSYGFMLVLAFVVGTVLALRRGKKGGIRPEKILDLTLLVLICSLIGSRFFYVIFHLDEFRGHFLDVINPFQSSGEIGIGGLSMMGGVVLAVVAGLGYLFYKKLPLWKVADTVAPSFALGLGLARIGCFLNGCCPGKPTDSFLGVVFPPDSFAGYFFQNTKLLPTQIFESLAGFIIFSLLIFLEKFKTFEGYTFWLMLAFYSAWRFMIDFFRYYEESMVFAHVGSIEFSMNQAISLLILLVSISMWFYFKSKKVGNKTA
jgi:phosphatidylglycerol:prolipoprotein diacylglycerol transferase